MVKSDKTRLNFEAFGFRTLQGKANRLMLY